MKTYKPEYLGKVIPANDASKLTDFVTNQYDAFSKIYETCKDSSSSIKDISVIEGSSNNSSLIVKITTDKDTLDNISKKINNDKSINMTGDVIMAK